MKFVGLFALCFSSVPILLMVAWIYEVHRLDIDCSGILVMGRTQTSAAVLHSIFREKTSRASDDIDTKKRILQRRYWALVIGCPRRSKGLVTASLGKVVVDNGKSDRIA
ncbi:RNA pseudouridine synthase 4, mitochondrial-like [Gastrolobium bilobum]|uniref:RNA pseudouridine synthase 4, mitochondrial-like n=1 Tax=Gastrolobium bilobum TaxID=150636 RepID=UPI002AB0CBE7|nr:RNA pseudouridine synthase 4, mitochondrial-like [Gastrolobium bilobum]